MAITHVQHRVKMDDAHDASSPVNGPTMVILAAALGALNLFVTALGLLYEGAADALPRMIPYLISASKSVGITLIVAAFQTALVVVKVALPFLCVYVVLGGAAAVVRSSENDSAPGLDESAPNDDDIGE